jgi:serine/threonine protein kinase
MTWLSDDAVERLRRVLEEPDLEGTRYTVVRRLGRGGMGSVWLAEDERLGREVALKVLDVPDEDGRLAARLRREARVLAGLEHPGIVPVHDVGQLADGRVFYAMKRVEGERLDQIAPRLGLAERLRVLRRVIEAVGFAHTRGIVHRDLKPENVMVGPFGEVLVLDWGLAKVLAGGVREPEPSESEPPAVEAASAAGSATTAHGAVLGTPGWMAPEQARGDNASLDARADIYALGGLLAYLLAHPAEPAPPRPLGAIAAKAMAPEPDRRYPRAAALGAEVDRWLDGLPVGAYREGLLERARRLAVRHRAAILLVLTYLLVRALLLLRARG